MERSSTIGYVLIFILFAGFWYFSNENAEELEAQEDKVKQEQIADSSDVVESSTIDSSSLDKIVAVADSTPESVVVLGNDLLTIELSSKGGIPKKVSLSEYVRYDSSELILFEDNQMSLGYTIPLVNGTLVNTLGTNFTAQKSSDNEVAMTAEFGGGAKIIQTYTVVPGSYRVGYRVSFEGFDKVISPNNRYAELNWVAKIQKQEKSIKDERNASTVYYKYAFDDDVDYLSETSDEDDEKLTGNVKWISFKQKFFNQTLINENQFTEDGIEISTKTQQGTEEYLKEFNAKLFIPIDDNSEVSDMSLYYGPNHYQTLQKEEIELQKMIPLGWGIFGWVNKGIVIPIFNWLDNYFTSYGLIILLLTLIIKMALFFPMFKVYKSTAKMKLLKPELDEIKERTGGDMQKAQQEQMKLYKQAGVSPLGGCLPQLVQMPILFAMFRFFPSSIELRQQKLWWADDLSTYDSIYDFPNGFEIPFYGDHISLFTLMMTTVTLIYTYMNSQNSGQMVGPMKTVMYLMPLMFLGFFNNYAAALSFYYFLSTCITIIQNFVIRKFVIDEDKLHKQIQESKKKKVKTKKSGLQKRLEDMAKKRGIDPRTGKPSVSAKEETKEKIMKRTYFMTICLALCLGSIAQSATDFYKRAVMKYKDQDYGGAIVEYTRAIDLRDNSAVLYNNRGVCKFKMERYSEAIDDYDKAILADSSFVHSYFNKGNSLLGIKEFQLALSCFDRAIKLDSNYKKAYLNRSKVFYQLGDYKSSIQDLDRVLSLGGSKNIEKVYLERGNARMQLNLLSSALEDYNKAINLNPNYYKAFINRGQCNLRLNDKKAAINDFTLAMKLDGGTGESYYYRGLARMSEVGGVKASKKNKKTLKKISENKKVIELACSDFQKAKDLGYGRAFEAVKMYCE